MALGGGLMFVYYSTVYSTIQDVIEPSLRGTAMALYFFAMYVLGGSFGPVLTGFLSETFTRSAATTAGIVTLTKEALEPFRAAGLHSAMYLIPVLGGLLALVLFAASFTVRTRHGQPTPIGCSSWTALRCPANLWNSRWVGDITNPSAFTGLPGRPRSSRRLRRVS